jgi:hypothetical protein
LAAVTVCWKKFQLAVPAVKSAPVVKVIPKDKIKI